MTAKLGHGAPGAHVLRLAEEATKKGRGTADLFSIICDFFRRKKIADADGNEEEEGANGLGPLARSEDAAGAAALVFDDVAVEDSRRGHLREYRRLRQLMKKLYRVAKDKYDEDGDYEEFKKVEEAYSESVTKLDKKYPGLF